MRYEDHNWECAQCGEPMTDSEAAPYITPELDKEILCEDCSRDAELTTLRTEITAYDIRMDNDAAEIARLRTELNQARADVEAAKKVVDAAVAWRENMQHGRDHTDEGYSHPRDQDVEALADAVDEYLAARPAKPEQEPLPVCESCRVQTMPRPGKCIYCLAAESFRAAAQPEQAQQGGEGE